jgi:von Willebrand factor type D domain/Heterokaryon incompatibility protein Het-C
MRRIKFWALAAISFSTATVVTLFAPDKFLVRSLSVSSCRIFGLNSTFCAGNLRFSTERAMAANPVSHDVHKYYGQAGSNLKKLDKTDDTILAFKPDREEYGHIPITKEALKQVGPFTETAIKEIVAANRAVDLKPGSSWRASEDFSIPKNHFDNEEFSGGSTRLIELKDKIIDKLKKIEKAKDCYDSNDIETTQKERQKDRKEIGMQARKLLGGALHTLQDFYAHTNWVELGSGIIYEKLGRSVIHKLALDTHTSEVYEIKEWNKYTSQYRKSLVTHSGILLPAFKNHPSDPEHYLTSGYFMSISSSCYAPPGKTRHGSPICPNGLNKDKLGRPGYDEAKRLAVDASVDYIKDQIFQELGDNDLAKNALMGIEEEEKLNPCEKKSNTTGTSTGNYKQGKSYGDPHLSTFDDLSYSFQTVGEFILVKSNHGKFEIQVRQAPVNSSLSLNSAVAMKMGSDRVAFYSKEFPDSNTGTPLRINGKPTVIQGDSLSLSSGNTIVKSDDTYVVNFSTGEKVLIDTAQFGGNFYFNVSPFVSDSHPERYSGLLGNANGDPKDDQQIRGGAVLSSKSTYGDVKKVLNLVGVGQLPFSLDPGEKLYFDQLYKDFGNSWRIKQNESLFDYPPDKTTESYTDLKFPDKYLKLEMLSSKQIEKARSACTEAKVDPTMMEGCIFDVGFTGFSEFARATAEINSYLNTVQRLVPGVNVSLPGLEVPTNPLDVPRSVCLPFVGCVDR